MIVAESCYDEMINSVSRTINARVELYEGSTLLNTFTYDGALQKFTIERAGDASKFFGFGICQKVTVNLIDKDRLINIKKGQGLDIAIGVGCEYIYAYPVFYVDEVTRDENTNALTITAYDVIYKANSYRVSDLTLPESYNILYFMSAAAALLEVPLKLDGLVDMDILNTTYENGANFAGTESLREALDDVAEVTGMVYYINHDWELTFKKMDVTGAPVLTIDKSKYFTLTAKTAHNLESITHTTELGDNITVETNAPGDHQYLRENAFVTTRDDAHTILEAAFANVTGLTIYQFDCKWRGNFLLEIGDKIGLVTKDNVVIHSYILNDTVTYNGGLIGNTSWELTDNSTETESNPSTIGDALKNTFARVDKLNNEITLVASETDGKISGLNTSITELQLTTNDINISVERNAANTDNKLENMEQSLEIISNKVSSTMTSEEVEILVSNSIKQGTNSVETATGFTFNETGLTVSKTNSEISTTITEDGMTVYKDNDAMLTANNQGVEARNLHASTFLIIGNRCRFENFSDDRVGCFWIGG